MFKIGEFSKLCGLSVDTLYHYEKIGILLPNRIESSTGYRYYTASQILAVNKIMALKDAGFSLKEITELLHKEIPVTDLIQVLEKKALLLEEALNHSLNQMERLHTNIFLIKNGGIPQLNEIVMKQVEPILAASVRRKFPDEAFDSALEEMWNEVNESIDAHGVKRTIPCMMLFHTGWWNMGEEQLLDVEVVEPITKVFAAEGNVEVQTLERTENMACMVHCGPFSTMGKTYGAFFDWVKENGYTLCGPVREIYHKGDWATSNPDEYVTEIQAPVCMK